MNKKALISVLVCSYNNSESIIDSIESLQIQTYKNLEILLLDDKSSDDTKEKINYLSEKYENIRPFFNEANIGLTKSLNKLINYANGELIARHDSDDISFPNRFEKQLTILNEMKKLNILYYDIKSIKKYVSIFRYPLFFSVMSFR